MGGGFGSKLAVRAYNWICANLAKKAGKPVKLMLDREEELLSTGNRPSSIQKIKIGAKRNGKVTAFQMESYGTAGIGSGAGVPQPYIYEFPNVKIKHNDVLINAGPGAPMRAPGHPQANFAMESMMDMMAEKLGIDPLNFRMMNDPNTSRQEEYKIGAEKFGWSNRQKTGSQTGTKVRGMGVGSGTWGGGGNKRTMAAVKIYPDGIVELKQGTQDIGVGTRTYAAAVIAEELGLNYQDIKLLIGESDYPWANNSGGSTTAASVAPSVKLATEKALGELKKTIAEEWDVSADNINLVKGEFSDKNDSSKTLSWKRACALLEGQPIEVLQQWEEGLSDRGTAGCQFAEVEVDTETGEVKVLRVVAVQDCGLVLNRLTARNQVSGGIIGEIGYVTLENRIMDSNTGKMVNPDLENYKIPGPFEMPEFDVTFYDEADRGVIGLGEPPAIPGVGAIANAIANAIGVRIYELPITPDKVLMAIAKKKEGQA
jgi:xanthine dehydrogenase YagR molybdenum-binding subunit